MTPNDIQRASMLDLLFAGRNKQYGAYELRKFYNNRLGVALGITLAAAMLSFLLNRQFSQPGAGGCELPIKPEVVITDIVYPKPIEPDPIQPPPAKAVAPPAATTDFQTIRIVPDNQVIKPVASTTDLENRQVSNVTNSLPGNGPVLAGPSTSGTGDGPIVPPAPAPEPEPTYVANPSEAPFFPNFREYLASHISVPGDMEPGEKRSTLVRFQVSEEGMVTGIEVVRSAGATFDSEVLRVLRKMPRWKPARQNGRPVATTFQQAVTFQAPEE